MKFKTEEAGTGAGEKIRNAGLSYAGGKIWATLDQDLETRIKSRILIRVEKSHDKDRGRSQTYLD